MYSYLWGGGILFFFSNCLEKMEQYRYKYYTYSHYHSKLLKPERFLLVSLYVFTYQNSYTDTTGRKPDLSSYSSLTINNITHYSRYTCYRPPITSSPSKMPSDSPLTPPLQVNCTASRPTCTTTNSSTVFHINKYHSGILISVKFSKRSSSCFRS